MSTIKSILLECIDGLECSLDENGTICFGSEQAYREFMERVKEYENEYHKNQHQGYEP